ncbi:SOB five-like 1 [Raphanus sativus]|uniref:Protein SOB FIVE-LIKE 1 n=1 Tax=Raphanus sativus TaxID=3726 RepID=A0A6J0KPV8_RAPSA|nr:protein SOB FIVE-LIKE 1 [Raphanus sativus]XP_056848276.1 protein SOB FIVE-LIKE 1 [Raphanus sativus]KAJ4879758.1 SOB five-like 1 [Raphanus sativus]
MESPRNHGVSEEEEEYNSCESGWTMYIEDAFHGNDHSYIVADDEDDDDGVDIDDDSKVKEADDGGGDEESDDSMASDASSGPSNQLPKNINKNAARKNVSKQVCIQKSQHAEKTLSNEGEKSELKARTRTSAASRVQSKGKVSKTK